VRHGEGMVARKVMLYYYDPGRGPLSTNLRHAPHPPPSLAGPVRRRGLAGLRAPLRPAAAADRGIAFARPGHLAERRRGTGLRGVRHPAGRVQPALGIPSPSRPACAGPAAARPGGAVGRGPLCPPARDRGAARGGDDLRRHPGGARAPGEPAPEPRPRPRRQLHALKAGTAGRPAAAWENPPPRATARRPHGPDIFPPIFQGSRSKTMGKGDRKTAKGKRYISSYGNARPKAVAKASGGAAAPVAKAAKASAKAPARKAVKKVVAKAD